MSIYFLKSPALPLSKCCSNITNGILAPQFPDSELPVLPHHTTYNETVSSSPQFKSHLAILQQQQHTLAYPSYCVSVVCARYATEMRVRPRERMHSNTPGAQFPQLRRCGIIVTVNISSVGVRWSWRSVRRHEFRAARRTPSCDRYREYSVLQFLFDFIST